MQWTRRKTWLSQNGECYRTRANLKGLVLSGSHNLGCCKVCSRLQTLQCLKDVCDIAWVGVRRDVSCIVRDQQTRRVLVQTLCTWHTKARGSLGECLPRGSAVRVKDLRGNCFVPSCSYRGLACCLEEESLCTCHSCLRKHSNTRKFLAFLIKKKQKDNSL